MTAEIEMTGDLSPKELLTRAMRLIDESYPPDHSPLTTAWRDIRDAMRELEAGNDFS